MIGAIGEAFRKGLRAAWENVAAILALQAAMAAIVALYYLWPPAHDALVRYAAWQVAGGALGNGVAAALAGGVLSELSIVYAQDRGRWSWTHVESMRFKAAIFFVAGCIVFEFYHYQAVWWGQGSSPRVVIHKVLVDQFVYTVFWACPYYTLLTRWHALRYSFEALGKELDRHFVTERMLPVLVTNWMFWIPAITLVYAMPSLLQPPLYIFATAIWGLLVPAVTKQKTAAETLAAATSPALLADPAD